MLDSPYVRRVAISLKVLNIPFNHRPLSVFKDFDEFSRINPAVKAPTLVTDSGSVLMDSTLILQYAATVAKIGDGALMPPPGVEFEQSLRLISLALMACDKTVQIVYEHMLRPEAKQHQPWLDRVTQQLHGIYLQLEQVADDITLTPLLQPAISTAVAWRFTQLYCDTVVSADRYPRLAALSSRAEQLPVFVDTPVQ